MPTPKDNRKDHPSAASAPPLEFNRKAPEQSIGARVRSEREKLGLNFEQLAALTREYDPDGVGIAAVTLRRYERTDEGASSPGLRELRILCDALDVTADYLVRAAEPPPYETQAKEDMAALKGIVQRLARADPCPASMVRTPIRLPTANGF